MTLRPGIFLEAGCVSVFHILPCESPTRIEINPKDRSFAQIDASYATATETFAAFAGERGGSWR